jgi:4-hydroxymandelate oxidase
VKRKQSSKHRPRKIRHLAPPRRWPANLDEFEALAKSRLSAMAYAYVAGGAADELTMKRNREAFAEILLKPRVLVDVSKVDTRIELLGQTLEFPILLAPTACHRLICSEGERATARGAGAAGATVIVSTYATTAIEKIAQVATGPLWFQLYANPDRGFTSDLVARVASAGCRVLCLTVDSPVFGTRDRETRTRFHLPGNIVAELLRPLGREAQKAAHTTAGSIYSSMVDASLTWKDVTWLCSLGKLPVVLKGILTAEDARLAIDHGAAGIIVSNHGGRNLDTAPATLEALPAVAEAVDGRIPLLMDGGIRRGTDVLKALALGAQAVLIGRPYLWGLAVGGAAGVTEVIRILCDELRVAMALCGVPDIRRVSHDVLWHVAQQHSGAGSTWSPRR